MRKSILMQEIPGSVQGQKDYPSDVGKENLTDP